MNKKIIESPVIISNKLKNQDIKWCVIGSSSLALQNVNVKPPDIDILTDKEGAYKINTLLKTYEITPVKFSKTVQFSSHLGTFLINGIKVEIMGDLSIFIKGKWSQEIRKRLHSRKNVNYKGNVIPVSPLEAHLKSYKI